MNTLPDSVRKILSAARDQGRDVLLETEGLDLVEALGLEAPRRVFVPGADAVTASALADLPGERVVVKVVSSEILHKTDVGGVAVVAREAGAVSAAIAAMAGQLGDRRLAGYLIEEHIDYTQAPGHELLLGLRWTADFGPVVALGAGGVHTEFLSANLAPGRDVAVVSPRVPPAGGIERVLRRAAVVELATEEQRGQAPLVALERLADAVESVGALAALAPADVREFEINPLVAQGGRLVALDVLVALGDGNAPALPSRPLEKLNCLLEPRSIAVAGVSRGMNPGRVILQNLLREGFPREHITVIKPGADTIDGCGCVPDVASLPERVDMLVLAIDAAQAALALEAAITKEKAESIVVIPGGFEEKTGGDAIVARMHAALARSRATPWRGPLVNGGNCLGIRSLPGRVDTMFIPEYKTGARAPAPVGSAAMAFISQSGAFAVSKGSKLARVPTKYAITVGNQMDLTVADYLEHLVDDPDIEVFAVYLEGFKPLDGLRFLQAAARITASGRSVVLYRAGRSRAGAEAMASHTASVAGDYTVTRALARGAGVIVADTIADFEDLVTIATLLSRKRAGWRLGAVSNAGFECVAMADNVGRFTLAPLAEETRACIVGVLKEARLTQVVDVRNPVDLTPIVGDAGFAEVARAVLSDPGVDVGVLGCVPLTPALSTLPPGAGHGEDVAREGAIGPLLARLCAESEKACVVVIDGGTRYDPMARVLEDAGVAVFRTADRALRLFETYCAARLGAVD